MNEEHLQLVPLGIRGAELGEFHALTLKNQTRVRELLSAFDIIEAASSKMDGYTLAAQGKRGFTQGSLRRLYRGYVNAGRDWRALIDGAVEFTPANAGLPAEFVEELQRRADANARSVEMALKMLRAEWMQGKSVPGYGNWREWWRRSKPFLPVPAVCPGYPQGWSPSNLRSYLDRSKFRRLAQTRGLQAAHGHNKAQVYTTRAGLWCGSHFQFDDLWHDFFVASLAEHKAGRPLELFCHDVFSARKIAWGFRVRTENDNGKAQGLTAKMMRMLVAEVFGSIGYSPRGTTILAEHGTAGFSEALEQLLADASGGLVRVCRSGMTGAAAHAGQYPGVTRGNPRHKASLESSNNAIHNLTAALAGQTGPDRQRRPEQLAGVLNYSQAILEALPQLPPDVAANLRLPLLTETQCGQVLRELYALFDSMTEHNLEGWETAGNVVAELAFAGQWLAADGVLSLPADARECALAAMEKGKLATRTRKLSRGEVWHRGTADLTRVSGGVVCDILGAEFAQEQRVKAHVFEFRDKDIEPGATLRFESLCMGRDGASFYLPEAEKFLVTVNPFNASRLFVKDAAGRFLGECARIHAASRTDASALQAAIQRASKHEAGLLAPLRARTQREARERLALHRGNAAVLQSRADETAGNAASTLDALASHLSAAIAADEQETVNHEPIPSHEHNNENDQW